MIKINVQTEHIFHPKLHVRCDVSIDHVRNHLKRQETLVRSEINEYNLTVALMFYHLAPKTESAIEN